MTIRRFCLSLALLLAGCCHADVQIGSSSAGLTVQSGSTAGALIGLGFIAGVIHGSGDEYTRARTAPFGFDQLAPPMDDSRSVREQDCTRPIQEPGANLRCR